jgi:hypothetical protein
VTQNSSVTTDRFIFQVIQERKRKQLQSKETSHIEQDGDDIGKWVTNASEWEVRIRSYVE